MVGNAEFLKLADLLNIDLFAVNDRIPLLAYIIPNIYFSKVSKTICSAVKHK